MSVVLTNLKHFGITFLLLLAAVVAFGLYIGAEAHLFEDRLAYDLDGEVHVFLEDGATVARTLKGNNDDGFRVETRDLSDHSGAKVDVVFPVDGSRFDVGIGHGIETPAAIHDDGEPIIAVSDIESGFGAFREFLINHRVADRDLNWTFGKGHLVLVGDFVDRGASTTQVLWAIYKLEQSARQAGGQVHFILGNHEIKSLQGNYQSANEKYFYIAGMFGKQQYQLFDDNALLGRWLASKNVLEIINGVAFVHGGLHPDIAKYGLPVEEINRIVRAGYRSLYYTPVEVTRESFLRSSTTGPAWYRGYFKDDLSQQDVERGLAAVGAQAVVVGHTLQGKVHDMYDKKVFAIDVRHPKDYLTSFPLRASEGLLVKDGKYFRLLEDGGIKAL
ncbi:metallophosphoesterase [Lysobacter sp. F6437]|uniref:metallophosphoesterase n=1 Tax=Lysobacter sp. F6437 TaxID=3459296 RepID=UPI00403DB7F2